RPEEEVLGDPEAGHPEDEAGRGDHPVGTDPITPGHRLREEHRSISESPCRRLALRGLPPEGQSTQNRAGCIDPGACSIPGTPLADAGAAAGRSVAAGPTRRYTLGRTPDISGFPDSGRRQSGKSGTRGGRTTVRLRKIAGNLALVG